MGILDDIWFWLASGSTFSWLVILMQPWQGWRNKETLDVTMNQNATPIDLTNLTVIIPARNESEVIENTLTALSYQGNGLNVIIVDDQSSDNTANIIRNTHTSNLKIKLIQGSELPPSWAGKMWALEQALSMVKTDLVLLLDADIQLRSGMIAELLQKRLDTGARLVSVMAELRMSSKWEKLLMPAFIFFFKQLYPFQLSNSKSRFVAAAAGGCILIDRVLLENIGGFKTIKNSIIDDCTLASKAKQLGALTWIGLTHSAVSIREYDTLSTIWHMIERSAFTQLKYSILLLFLCTLIMCIAFWLPLISIAFGPTIITKLIGLIALFAMLSAYIPTLRYYKIKASWSLAMPIIGTIFIAITWSSAIQYWAGKRSNWKGRTYSRTNL